MNAATASVIGHNALATCPISMLDEVAIDLVPVVMGAGNRPPSRVPGSAVT